MLTINDIEALVADETTLTGESVSRRGSTVRSWLAKLPDVTVTRRGGEKVYEFAPEAQ